jgi:uncharacterized phage infection (PIP) family protein YhgE
MKEMNQALAKRIYNASAGYLKIDEAVIYARSGIEEVLEELSDVSGNNEKVVKALHSIDTLLKLFEQDLRDRNKVLGSALRTIEDELEEFDVIP